jgi:hypothetical protein
MEEINVHLTVPLALSYPVSFVPKGCRKATTEYFLADAFAELRAVDSTDAEVAFRVQTSGNFCQAEGTFEILSYDNQLWWPLRLFNRQDSTFPLATKDTLLNEIESGRENFLRLRPMWLAARRIETAGIREIVSNSYQAALAGAQRKITDYLLLCGATPYVADGEPVYVGSEIAGIGADRTARVRRDWTNYQARNSSSTLRNFCRGQFYRPDAFGKGANRHYIESLRPDLIRVQSEELQLDALFRCALEWLETKGKFPPAGEVKRTLAIFSDVADQDRCSSSISRDRLLAVNYFMEFVYKSYRRRYAFDPFADFELFARTQKLVSDPCNVVLTKHEEDALAGIAV